jgi:ubiquinone/menaquinone biosynthesis C-methylase UbiE
MEVHVADRRDHYSYAVYAESETALNFERKRFGGPIGGYMRRRQEEQVFDWLGDVAGRTILDVGTGTGRVAIPLAAAGAEVTAGDASEAMLDQARANAENSGVSLAFECCDAMAQPYPDKSFGAVISFRLLLHVVDWRKALSEICRCSSDSIILDFPPRWSLAALQVPVRAVAALFRPKTQRFRLFTLRRIRRELARNGFRIERVDRLFVLPIMLHKLFHSLRISLALEKLLGWLGLRRLFGAPVTILARRSSARPL